MSEQFICQLHPSPDSHGESELHEALTVLCLVCYPAPLAARGQSEPLGIHLAHRWVLGCGPTHSGCDGALAVAQPSLAREARQGAVLAGGVATVAVPGASIWGQDT